MQLNLNPSADRLQAVARMPTTRLAVLELVSHRDPSRFGAYTE